MNAAPLSAEVKSQLTEIATQKMNDRASSRNLTGEDWYNERAKIVDTLAKKQERSHRYKARVNSLLGYLRPYVYRKTAPSRVS
jgi:hypothetical protein